MAKPMDMLHLQDRQAYIGSNRERRSCSAAPRRSHVAREATRGSPEVGGNGVQGILVEAELDFKDLFGPLLVDHQTVGLKGGMIHD